MKCEGFKGLMRWQTTEISKHLEDHKYFESEKAGHDVGQAAAEQTFTTTYMPVLAADWRIEYCGAICPHRATCEMAGTLIASARRSIQFESATESA